MITKIAPNAPATVAESKLAAAQPKTATADPRIAHVAAQFEEVFVRQLLTAAKIGGGKDEGGGYGAMAVDALASGISEGGGLGIAKQIEAALSHSAGLEMAPRKTEKSE